MNLIEIVQWALTELGVDLDPDVNPDPWEVVPACVPHILARLKRRKYEMFAPPGAPDQFFGPRVDYMSSRIIAYDAFNLLQVVYDQRWERLDLTSEAFKEHERQINERFEFVMTTIDGGAR